MYEKPGAIENLVHLYVDGAFSRRELIRRLKDHTGSAAAQLPSWASSASGKRARKTPALPMQVSPRVRPI